MHHSRICELLILIFKDASCYMSASCMCVLKHFVSQDFGVTTHHSSVTPRSKQHERRLHPPRMLFGVRASQIHICTASPDRKKSRDGQLLQKTTPKSTFTPVHVSMRVYVLKVFSAPCSWGCLFFCTYGLRLFGFSVDGFVVSKKWNLLLCLSFAATCLLGIKKSGDEERRHLSAVIDFNTQQRNARDLIGQGD